MPARLRAWYTAAEIEALAARRAELCGEFTVAEMDRLVAHIGTETGTASARFTFARQNPSWLALDVALQARLSVICQRCLGPLDVEISERVEFGVLIDENSFGVLPEGIEPVGLDGDRLSLLRLVEDELIIAVPMVPKHLPEHCAIDSTSPSS